MAGESEVCGFNQCLIKATQFFTAFEIYIGCKLTLINTPVVEVAENLLDTGEQAVYLFYHSVKGIRQFFVKHMVSGLMCFFKILYYRKINCYTWKKGCPLFQAAWKDIHVH